MDSLAAEARLFTVETTLASRSLAPRLRDLQSAGYRVVLLYVWVPAPELSVSRGGCKMAVTTFRQRQFIVVTKPD